MDGTSAAQAPTPESALRAALVAGRERSLDLGGDYPALWSCLSEASEGGGRFRPALLTAAYTAAGGTDLELAATVGAAVELLHTAFVIHDDVIDGDRVRRGRLNVGGTFEQRALLDGAAPQRAAVYGDTAAILAGDLALVRAVRMVATSSAQPAIMVRLLDLFDEAIHISAAGELADVRLSLGIDVPHLDDVLTMSEQKTAAYSFVLPLQAGAVLAGAPDAVVDRLAELGRLMGIGYQLLDDLRGVFGDEAVTGKSTIGDLREGKRTTITAHARETSAWHQIVPYLGSADLTEAEAALVRDLLTACGSRHFVERLARQHVEAALSVAEGLGLPGSVFSCFGDIARAVLRRAA